MTFNWLTKYWLVDEKKKKPYSSPSTRTGSSTFTHWELGMATREPFSLRIRRIVMTSPSAYCLVSMATTLQRVKQKNVSAIRPLTGSFPPHRSLPDWLPPLQVCTVNGLVADGTLGPAALAERQVVQHARPAEDVSAASDACGQRWVQADWARRHLVTVDALQDSES